MPRLQISCEILSEKKQVRRVRDWAHGRVGARVAFFFVRTPALFEESCGSEQALRRDCVSLMQLASPPPCVDSEAQLANAL